MTNLYKNNILEISNKENQELKVQFAQERKRQEEQALKQAYQKAKRAEEKTRKTGKWIVLSISLIGAILILYHFFTTLHDTIPSSISIVVALLLLLGGIGTFVQQSDLFIGSLIAKVAKRKFNSTYEREVEDVKRLLGLQ